ncbi:hypothetical protein O181_046085 [Austropuccinia psidii MF-1]|uniref:Uncharacterized protein n=1 Tax=Austropuccinia psidii MF-1 TaxID=1389203 RepID=A0A9Q3DMU3_9BASI|nr:hypothetical protein [Austropuccinia psidii MF-1]
MTISTTRLQCVSICSRMFRTWRVGSKLDCKEGLRIIHKELWIVIAFYEGVKCQAKEGGSSSGDEAPAELGEKEESLRLPTPTWIVSACDSKPEHKHDSQVP